MSKRWAARHAPSCAESICVSLAAVHLVVVHPQQPRMRSPTLRAFIGRPKGMEVGALLEYLVAANVQPDDPTMRVSSGEPPATALLAAVRACDVGVIVYARDESHLLYELGALDALKKPVIVVSEPDQDLPPTFLRYLTARGPLSGSQNLHTAIDRFIEQVRRSKSAKLRTGKSSRSTRQEQKDRAADSQYQAEVTVESLRDKAPRDVEWAVAELFRSAGGIVAVHEGSMDRGVDLVLLSATTGEPFARPLLVEVKSGSLSSGRIHDAEVLLQHAVDKSGAIGGLLVYFDRADRRFEDPPAARTVRRVAFQDLVQALGGSSLKLTVERLFSGQVEPIDG